MFVPMVAGSNGTMVSVATGQNEYHLVYLSVGNVHNQTWRARHGTLVLVGFLAIPKSELIPISLVLQCWWPLAAGQETANTMPFWSFKKQLFHTSLKYIFQRLHPYMLEPDLIKCADGHYQKAIYRLGPYITDYPKQVLLAGIVSGWFVK